MLPNDNITMSVGYLDHVLIVYNSMERINCFGTDKEGSGEEPYGPH